MDNVFHDREGVCPMDAMRNLFESSIPYQTSAHFGIASMAQTPVRGDGVFDRGEP